ncbi:PHP domain-containing protein, partial [[Kitasatospora] papulosa]
MGGGVHLHVASGYSARYGASHPHDLVARAAERGISTLALTDRDTVTGIVRFAKAAMAAGVRPVLGVDLAVAPHTLAGPALNLRTPVRGGAHVAEAPLRVTLLAQDISGWARLCRIVSTAHATAAGGPPVVTWPVLQQYADEKLTILLGPASEPVRALSAGRPDLAEQLLAPWQEVAGANLRLEVLHWGLQGLGAGSSRLAAHTLGLADRLAIPTVLTNAVRYADPAQHRIADVLDAARRLRPIDARALDCGERWLKGPEQMAAAAELMSQSAGAGPGRAAALLAETARTAEECEIDPVIDLGLGRSHFPEPTVVGAEPTLGGAMRLLTQRCEAGMAARG